MSDTRRSAAAAAAMLRDSGQLRMALRGTSMLPSIAEPMVLQIGSARRAGIGDVLVFRAGDIDVAHRIVAIEANGFRTAGDAQPHVVESVPLDRIVGRVLAIWSDASLTPRRVDDRAHRFRGWYYARFHGARRAAHAMRNTVRYLVERVQPRRRARVAPRFVAAIAAIARCEPQAFVDALACDAGAFGALERRHRCAAMFGDAARRFGVAGGLRAEVTDELRRARIDAVIATGRMERNVNRTVDVLRSAGIEFALLKGAARIYGKVPGAAYHPSGDIDVFVRACDVDRAVSALESQGWGARESPQERRRYRRHHHHAAPLYSPDGDYPVEIHHQLALPGTLSLDTTWEALRDHLVVLDGQAGSVLQLDRVATALHLAIHAAGLARLRDIALLAFLLPALNAGERVTLENMVCAEHRDPVRLAASLALAARAAGIPWSEGAGVASYIRWALRREDLPAGLRRRSEPADICFARPDAPWMGLGRLAPWWSRGGQIAALPIRVFGHCAASVVAAAYAAQLPEGEDLRSADQAFCPEVGADVENVALGAGPLDGRHGHEFVDDIA